MPRKRPDHHIFKHIDLGDVGAIRRLMSALAYYLSRRVLHPHVPEILALRGPEKTAAESIICSVRNHRALYPLLLEGVLRFINARNMDDQEVLQAAKGLDGLARGVVLAFPGDHYEEYVAAEVAFYGNDGTKIDPQKTQVLVDTAPGAFGEQVFSTQPDTRALEAKLRWPRLPSPAPMTINQNECRYCAYKGFICSKQEPRCYHCLRRNIECNYPPPGSTPSTDNLSSLCSDPYEADAEDND